MIRIFDSYVLRFSELSDIQWIFLMLFFLVFLIRLTYRLILFLWLFKKRKKSDGNNLEQISLILTVRNQEDDIQNYLPGILSASGNLHEVIVVDDFSQDNSLTRLGLLKTVYPQLHLSSLSQETKHSVKLARNIALKAARNSWITAIPLNTRHITDVWFSHMQNSLNKNRSVIVNYNNISPGKGFINLLYRTESFIQQIRSYGFCAAGLPFVYDETNVAFRKEKYFETRGYGLKLKENYANLELILNTFMKNKHMAVCLTSETAVLKAVQASREDCFDLLRKSIRIEKHLSFFKKVTLRIEKLSDGLLIPVFAILFIVVPGLWPFYVIPVFILFTLYLVIIKTILNRLKERKLFLSSLIYAVLGVYFTTAYQTRFNYRNRKRKWKSKI